MSWPARYERLAAAGNESQTRDVAARGRAPDAQHVIDVLADFAHVRYDADHASAGGLPFEFGKGLIERVQIERTEPFVEEERAEMTAAAG